PNDCSLVLVARGDAGPDLWLCGDIEFDGEARMAQDSALVAPVHRPIVLKAAHHGSDTSSTDAWLARSRPDIALVSVGAFNRYGHPGHRALASLAACGCTILRTDQGGAVRVTRRGSALWIERPGARAVCVTCQPLAVDALRGSCLECDTRR